MFVSGICDTNERTQPGERTVAGKRGGDLRAQSRKKQHQGKYLMPKYIVLVSN